MAAAMKCTRLQAVNRHITMYLKLTAVTLTKSKSTSPGFSAMQVNARSRITAQERLESQYKCLARPQDFPCCSGTAPSGTAEVARSTRDERDG